HLNINATQTKKACQNVASLFLLFRYPSGHRLASPQGVVVMSVYAERIVHDGAKEFNYPRISKNCLTIGGD
ncbi:MAG: hypothetical protein ACK51D_16520, partial [Cyclobacteriaceae bacterium]